MLKSVNDVVKLGHACLRAGLTLEQFLTLLEDLNHRNADATATKHYRHTPSVPSLILDLLRTSDKPLRCAEIAKKLGIKLKHCGMTLSRLCQKGLVKRIGQGLYCLPDTTPSDIKSVSDGAQPNTVTDLLSLFGLTDAGTLD